MHVALADENLSALRSGFSCRVRANQIGRELHGARQRYAGKGQGHHAEHDEPKSDAVFAHCFSAGTIFLERSTPTKRLSLAGARQFSRYQITSFRIRLIVRMREIERVEQI